MLNRITFMDMDSRRIAPFQKEKFLPFKPRIELLGYSYRPGWMDLEQATIKERSQVNPMICSWNVRFLIVISILKCSAGSPFPT